MARPTSGTTGAYLRVGPCRNLTYVGAFRPRIALIVDPRMDNLLEHLVFKLLMAQAETPLRFLGLLFGRHVPAEPPAGLPPESLVAALEAAPVVEDLQQRIDHLYGEFCRRQLDITNVNESTHANLDQTSVNRHFLTASDRYEYVRELHTTDRIIPLLGNMTSDPSIDEVNGILSNVGEALATVYVSNIEEHIIQRCRITGGSVSEEPNPEGLLNGEYEKSCRAMVEGLARLDAEEDALLIRFIFPGEYRGRTIGEVPWIRQ